MFTTRDGGKSWYRLAGAKNRAVDIAVGSLDGKKALYALTAAGLEVFDGTAWTTIADAPARGRTLAIRSSGGAELVFVAGAQGVKAGVHQRRAHLASRPTRPTRSSQPSTAAAAPAGRCSSSPHASSARSSSASRSTAQWAQLTLPASNTDVASVVPDPFIRNRYYVGTLGDGVFVYEGKMSRYVAKVKENGAQLTGGAQ